ncbi:endonuclease/exonuclease/phosphatase family protein [Ancylomarina sp. DW003]|nr:endonuclease/exonuclease/phosphatase family protein [Ancylomarina sp. DW003]MDE5423438.1 endonuclease/exonuclease/phosphatase family protein [Ancylomarina sp. DW003]
MLTKSINMRTLAKIHLVILSFLSAACDPFGTKIGDEVSYFEAAEPETVSFPDTLKVMTWNVKFGGGRIDFFFDCHGDRVIMKKEEVEQNMNLLVEKIREVNPDILFLQEVDINAKRSALMNQVQFLLDKTELNFGVYASQWKAKYIPSDGIGRMNSGNAILSKWQLNDAKRIGLPLIAEQNAIVRYFYLKRNLLHAKLKSSNGELNLVNTHASAYAKDNTKKQQLEIIKHYADSLNSQGLPFILAGDFNALPPNTKQTQNFGDSVCEDGDFDADDYSTETDWMLPYYESYQSAICLGEYSNNNLKHFTHTTDKNGFWNRKTDYIFTNKAFVSGSGQTIQDWMEASDHAPIVVMW